MQVRLAFSIAIRAHCDILVLDEILAVGDAAFQSKCNEYFRNLKGEQTIILVTHDMLIEPLVVFVSNRTIDLRVYKDNFRWINYLSGVAVIVDEANKVTVLPVRGDEVGWMTFRDEVDEGV